MRSRLVAIPFQASDWESIRRIRARRPTVNVRSGSPLASHSARNASPPRHRSSGGLPLVRDAPRAGQARYDTRPRAVAACVWHLGISSLQLFLAACLVPCACLMWLLLLGCRLSALGAFPWYGTHRGLGKSVWHMSAATASPQGPLAQADPSHTCIRLRYDTQRPTTIVL